MKLSFLSPAPAYRQALNLPWYRAGRHPSPLRKRVRVRGLIKLQFLKGRKAGTKFLLDASAGTKIKIFSACWTKPFTIVPTERFERDL
jgi:hypothetical protein